MKINKFIRLFNTVKYLKFKQIYMRIYYNIRQKFRNITGFKYSIPSETSNSNFEFSSILVNFKSYEYKNKFTFLNISKSFLEKIDWNFSHYGKLWTYNLTYFDYLHQDDMTEEEGLRLIYDFIEQSTSIEDGLEPFPISLRGINWIKFLSRYQISDQRIGNALYAQYMILMDNLEYHLLGNHLLENGFSLLFGAYYFQNEKFYAKAKEILTKELDEQILNDGAHFELSPMYHQIMLYRVFDCINLIQNNSWKDHELLPLLTKKAEIMSGWLNTITYRNGSIPLLNDSANKIAPTTKELNDYASSLNIKTKKLELSDSGYRKIENNNYELIVDVGNIGPDYIPGHAHSDTFSFELYIEGEQFIVDTGLSTYETNKRRIFERSTVSHNTVQVEGEEQSEVWGAFRVASRAKVIDLVEKKDYISAFHDGYKKKLGVMHQREFIFENNSIKIVDTIHSKNRYDAVARLHFYPGVHVEKKDDHVVCNGIPIFSSSNEFEILEYLYAPEFNKTIPAQMLEIKFNDTLEVEIEV